MAKVLRWATGRLERAPAQGGQSLAAVKLQKAPQDRDAA